MSVAGATLEPAATVAEPPARSEPTEGRETEAAIPSLRPRTLGDLDLALRAAVKHAGSVGKTVGRPIRRALRAAGGPA